MSSISSSERRFDTGAGSGGSEDGHGAVATNIAGVGGPTGLSVRSGSEGGRRSGTDDGTAASSRRDDDDDADADADADGNGDGDSADDSGACATIDREDDGGARLPISSRDEASATAARTEGAS